MMRACAISRRRLMALVGGLAAAGLPQPVAADDAISPVVVELFTSQGCSSCPPADALLGELTRRRGVIALSLNVDYWDYLGWRDTLASPEHSKRQRDYAARRGDGQVYTPQMVIGGRRHVVGSSEQAVTAALVEEAARPPETTVEVALREQGPEVVIEVAGAPTDRLKQDSTVWMLMIEPKVSVKIDRGENTGKSIDYYHVVRKMIPAGMWHGEAISLRLPKADLYNERTTACAALLQVGGTGPIIGAAWMAAHGG
jgi:hypothetical protein